MQPRIRDNHPLRRLFAGLVENTFGTQVGVCDPRLTDYLAELLIDFLHVERIEAVRDSAGQPLGKIGELLAALARGERPGVGFDDGVVYRYMGDYALFWSGLYPEGLRRRNELVGADSLSHMVRHGKRSYAIASELAKPETRPPPRLLRRLSAEFESCVYGLGLVRRGWERTDPQSCQTFRQLIY